MNSRVAPKDEPRGTPAGGAPSAAAKPQPSPPRQKPPPPRPSPLGRLTFRARRMTRSAPSSKAPRQAAPAEGRPPSCTNSDDEFGSNAESGVEAVPTWLPRQLPPAEAAPLEEGYKESSARNRKTTSRTTATTLTLVTSRPGNEELRRERIRT